MRLSIATRIFLGFAAVLAVFGAVSTFAVWRMHAIGDEIRLVSEAYLPLTKVAAELTALHADRTGGVGGLSDERTQNQLVLQKQARLYFPPLVREKLAEARRLTAGARRLAGPDEAMFLERVDAQIEDIARDNEAYDAGSEALFTAMAARVDSAEDVKAKSEELRRVEKRLGRGLTGLSQSLDGRIQERVRETQTEERTSSWAIVGLSLAAILLGLGATVLSQRLLAPIRTLTQAAVRIGHGDYGGAAVSTRGTDEVGVLAGAFNQMAASLAERERELEEKQQALVRAEKLATIGRVAAQITHEIRNPLSSIGLNAELLAEEIPEDAPGAVEARRLCAAIAREVDRLTEITEDYLRMARLPKPELASEDLATLVRELVGFVRPELEAAGVRVQVDVPPALVARVDEAQLRQALLNLVRNAREAMPRGGSLVISARRGDGTVELVVRDDGVGMSRENAARIFEPFFTTKAQGTGLGLSLTQQIVEQHGGTLTCETAPGSGTTFTLSLPGAEAA